MKIEHKFVYFTTQTEELVMNRLINPVSLGIPVFHLALLFLFLILSLYPNVVYSQADARMPIRGDIPIVIVDHEPMGTYTTGTRIRRGSDPHSRAYRTQQFRELVSLRSSFIRRTYGASDQAWSPEVKFVRYKDWPKVSEADLYDPSTSTFTVPLMYALAALPSTMGHKDFAKLGNYSPRVKNNRKDNDRRLKLFKEKFPIIAVMDQLIAHGYLRQRAIESDSWLEKDRCFFGTSLPLHLLNQEELEKRLACEMVISGLLDHFEDRAAAVFHEDHPHVWPESLDEIDKEKLIAKVVSHGGAKLMRAPIKALSIGGALDFVLTHPFRIEGGNVARAAGAYQEMMLKSLSYADVSMTAEVETK